jgi:ribosomal protein S6
MQSYEAVIILVHHAAEDRQKELVKKVDTIFSKFGAAIRAHHDRGKRNLGYPMKKHKEGHVYIYDVDVEPLKVSDLVRELRLEEELLQVMVAHPIRVAKDSAKEVLTSGR